ncbi:4Fe-4S dicluster domain-containing protein [Paraoerskovia marina]|uniref:4Fe-4S dicluster domain-containing protein n=1 Tax=Paraoerskovia marina TaxID=545619 RepID=UPI000492AEE0|nr:4Fe-4S dicluster domain-containing protein [Paraoerskovia marina]
MRVLAHMGMVMHLDRCIGCHTCSVACKQVQSAAEGLEYAWFNDVETRPGRPYPSGPRAPGGPDSVAGWVRTSAGELRLRDGGRLRHLFRLFAVPGMPTIDEYVAPAEDALRPRVGGPAPERMGGARGPEPEWRPAPPADRAADPVLRHLGEHATAEIAQTFSFYLPRICEHCINPACVAACPSGALSKRVEDGIVLVDQDRCRGWRSCVPACPYGKMYINPVTGKAAKCTLCVERIEVGEPTLCSETCVGRLRYTGIVLYDGDRVEEAASVEDPQDLLQAQRDIILDPHDPEVVAAAEAAGFDEDWIMAAQYSPIYQLVSRFQVALPLHPEYRTLPMIWYVPPLSPVVDVVASTGADGEDFDTLVAAFEQLDLPVDYLAETFSAGDRDVVAGVLRRLAAVRSLTAGSGAKGPTGRAPRARRPDPKVARAVDLSPADLGELHQLLTNADYADRNIIPPAPEPGSAPPGGCSLDDLGGPGGTGPGAGAENGPTAAEKTRGSRFNLLGWSGKDRPHQLFPDRV